MKIFDAHVHFSHIASFDDCAKRTSNVDYSEQGFLDECERFNVVRSVCMGLSESKPAAFPDACAATPMLADMAASLPQGMSLCLGINPHTLNERSLAEMEELIKGSGVIAGMKLYAGYYHFYINDPVYDPIYALAEKYDLAVAVHSGDTYSDRGLLKYSQPLCVDELAVKRPDLRIVICHMGVPWVFDACEVAAKNRNVYVDLSGMLVGDADFVRRMTTEPLIVDRCRQALAFLDDYDKVLFGTDWPLAPMGAYIDFCKKLIPTPAHEKVFYENALKVYG